MERNVAALIKETYALDVDPSPALNWGSHLVTLG
jgi:hypothetical protein